jgi:hypothetical protein
VNQCDIVQYGPVDFSARSRREAINRATHCFGARDRGSLSVHWCSGQHRRRYTEDGRLSIDDNVSERTLRHQAIGKNWLFLGNEQAGPRAAVLFTILAGAKRHRIES